MAETAGVAPGDRRAPAPDLPPCAYRAVVAPGALRCDAAAGAAIAERDCRACSIPAAVAHRDACLYLTPLRHGGRARYACRWFFSAATEPAPDDWRNLCFCPYWFPRGGDERHVLERTAARRVHYLRVLSGDAPRRPPRASPVYGRATGPPDRGTLPATALAIWQRMWSHGREWLRRGPTRRGR